MSVSDSESYDDIVARDIKCDFSGLDGRCISINIQIFEVLVKSIRDNSDSTETQDSDSNSESDSEPDWTNIKIPITTI